MYANIYPRKTKMAYEISLTVLLLLTHSPYTFYEMMHYFVASNLSILNSRYKLVL